MTLRDLGNIGEFVGAIGVVASPIARSFVGDLDARIPASATRIVMTKNQIRTPVWSETVGNIPE